MAVSASLECYRGKDPPLLRRRQNKDIMFFTILIFFIYYKLTFVVFLSYFISDILYLSKPTLMV